MVLWFVLIVLLCALVFSYVERSMPVQPEPKRFGLAEARWLMALHDITPKEAALAVALAEKLGYEITVAEDVARKVEIYRQVMDTQEKGIKTNEEKIQRLLNAIEDLKESNVVISKLNRECDRLQACLLTTAEMFSKKET